MIIGVTGFLGSGKDTVADFLIKKGYHHYSLSDELRAILKEKKIKINRDNLREFANKLRREEGPEYLALKVIKKIRRPAVITSIRGVAEVEVFRKLKDFKLIFVDAPQKLRFERLKKRARENDEVLTFARFKLQEKVEKSQSKNKQQLSLVAKMADFKIINNADLPTLNKKINVIIGEIKNAKKES
jgi:dephospho-CoA kinase